MTPKPWYAYDAYLFDIDGTLLHCTDAVHYFAFCDALSLLAGRPVNLDGVTTQGSVDIAILRDAFALAGVPERVWRPRLTEICGAMGDQVEANRADLRCDVLPGVPQVLAYLHERGATLGVATGNLARIGRAKLQAADLWRWMRIGGFSDGLETRSAVFTAAVEQTRAITNASATICVFGDTPADILAAQQTGVDVIAIATGIFSYEELASHSPTRCLHCMADLSLGSSPVVPGN